VVIRLSFSCHSVGMRLSLGCHLGSLGGKGWDLPMDFINYFSIEFNL